MSICDSAVPRRIRSQRAANVSSHKIVEKKSNHLFVEEMLTSVELSALCSDALTDPVCLTFPGGAELPQGDGVEGEHAPRLPGHLPPRGAAAQLHRAAGGDGVQPGHPRVEEVASHRLPRPHAAAAGRCAKSAVGIEEGGPSSCDKRFKRCVLRSSSGDGLGLLSALPPGRIEIQKTFKPLLIPPREITIDGGKDEEGENGKRVERAEWGDGEREKRRTAVTASSE